MKDSVKRKCSASILAAIAVSTVAITADIEAYTISLSGGYFYGPGPIVPDTSLPDGEIREVQFDLKTLSGVAPFTPLDKPLSDGKTLVNANIDAGELKIGEEGSENRAFWLVAVDGGPENGQETYRFEEDYDMVWRVDLGLDPGFPDGIIRVDGFELTTGWVEIPSSEQTVLKVPGGYDKAGTLKTGDYLLGRVGDFDRNGMLDGIVVAAAKVPMQAELLPGAPVGNKRGFTTDIPVDPFFAAELTLRGVASMRPVIEKTMEEGNMEQIGEYLSEMRSRILTAQGNYEDNYLSEEADRRPALREIGWRIEAISQLIFIPWAFLNTYEYIDGKTPESIRDSTGRAMDKIDSLVAVMEEYRGSNAGAE